MAIDFYHSDGADVVLTGNKILPVCRNLFKFTDNGFKILTADVYRKYLIFGKRTYIIRLKKPNYESK